MRISVITVAFNSIQTIGDTLDSVAIQTHEDVEHLVIDGASVDSTKDLVGGHLNPNIRFISEPDDGIYDAMNKGFGLATGEVVGFLNSDDYFSDDRVLEEVSEVFQDDSVDVCYGDLVYVSQDNTRMVRYWKSKMYATGHFAKGWCPAHPTFYVRRSAIDRLGGFDLSFKLAADADFMMRYLETAGLTSKYIPRVMVRMRVGGVTNKNLINIIRQNRDIFAALRKNRIQFSILNFLFFKIVSRLGQYWKRNCLVI